MEEEKKQEQLNETSVTEENYASLLSDAIKQKDAEIDSLKKAQAGRIKELTDLVLNGGKIDAEESEQVFESRKELFEKYKKNEFSNNYEYWKNFLELRDATIREYGKDPCVTGAFGTGPDGSIIEASYGEGETINEYCEFIRKCLEESKGNAHIFNLLLKGAK